MTQQRWPCTVLRAVGAVKRGLTFRSSSSSRGKTFASFICQRKCSQTGQNKQNLTSNRMEIYTSRGRSHRSPGETRYRHLLRSHYARSARESAACSFPDQRIVRALLYPRHRAMQSLDTADKRWRFEQLGRARSADTSTHAQSIPALVLTCRLPRHSASAHSAEEYDRKDPSFPFCSFSSSRFVRSMKASNSLFCSLGDSSARGR
jgi:hypothetical protein